eukprot:3251185-Pyramimonas_sp.AAC.1
MGWVSPNPGWSGGSLAVQVSVETLGSERRRHLPEKYCFATCLALRRGFGIRARVPHALLPVHCFAAVLPAPAQPESRCSA